MRTIWKYPLEIRDAQRIEMPKGAQILTVQMQGEQACLWAMVDDGAPRTDRVIEIFGTGNPVWVDMGVQRDYIATFQHNGFVWHVFESR